MIERKIQVLPNPAAVAEAAARRVVDAAQRSIAANGIFRLGLSGGQTPRPLYQLLATPAFAEQINWELVEVYFADERCVPPQSQQSNYAMAEATLLEHVPVPAGQVYRIRGEIDPQEAAVEYGKMLRSRFGVEGLDLLILGMGADGHTASLFPGSAALDETEHRCVAHYVEQISAWRITLSRWFINRSEEVIVLVTGADKAPTLQQVLEADPDPQRFPIAAVAPESAQMTWFLDAAAAGMG